MLRNVTKSRSRIRLRRKLEIVKTLFRSRIMNIIGCRIVIISSSKKCGKPLQICRFKGLSSKRNRIEEEEEVNLKIILKR